MNSLSPTRASLSPSADRIAVIGMSARFPGAADIEEFWRLLDGNESGIRKLSMEELRLAGVSEPLASASDYVPFWGGPPDAEGFDAAFFGYSPRDAELLDPQQRVFLECAWNALEDAGYDSNQGERLIGVYAGASISGHLLRVAHKADPFQVGLANIGGMVAARTSFHLDLKGPSIGVQTTCSSSLVALHQAMLGLRQGDCDLAIAGAVAVNQSRPEGYRYEAESIAAPDGCCRPFDADAAGTVFTNGAGAVVLKRLEDALADGDTIHGVLLGSAVNNDGANKASLNAPSVTGQAAVLAAALTSAGVGAGDIDYVEAHGTGTALGDPIELAALNRSYGPGLAETGRRCAVGAVKGHVGHLDAAAGMAGLVKILLAFRKEKLPGIAHFTQPNPKCSFGAFDVLSRARDWLRDSSRLRRAGLSSFGIGGTNAHLIIEEPPAQVAAEPSTGMQLLPLSARTPTALSTLSEALARALEAPDAPELAEVAFTLQTGRRSLEERQFIVAADRQTAVTALRAGQTEPMRAMAGAPSPVFVFSGQGSQRAGMARDLHISDPAFREALEECLTLMPQELDLGKLLLDTTAESADLIHETRYTQPALFAFEYALARMWMARGIVPVALLGHSIGEYVAACLAGVFDLGDAVKAVVARGALMQECSPGAMLAVMISETEAAGNLPDGVEIAAINGPRSIVVAGDVAQIDELAARFDRSGIGCRLLRTSHAFHSGAMEPALKPFRQVLEGLNLNAPQIGMLSNVTGDWLGEEAAAPDYWLRQLRQPVRYGAGVKQIMQLDHPLLLEVGPGAGLIRLARQSMHDNARGVASLPEAGAKDGSAEVLQATGELWVSGLKLNWPALHVGKGQRPPRRVSLPGYPFERQSFWVPPAASSGDGTHSETDDSTWFHQPVWQRLPMGKPEKAFSLLMLGADAVATLGGDIPQDAIPVSLSSDYFEKKSDGYSIDPENFEHYLSLFSALKEDGVEVNDIICGWGLEAGRRSYAATTTLARALMEAGLQPRLTLLGAGMREVTGRENLDPDAAMVLGMVPVLPQEIPGLRCRSIDLDLAETSGKVPGLNGALDTPWDRSPAGTALALRGGYLWRGGHVPVHVEAAPHAKPDGPCLVIGDLADGLGAIYARGVRQELGKPLILAGNGLPNASDWDGWLATHGPAHPTSRLIAALRGLGKIGTDILVLEADETDADQLEAALNGAEAQLGPIAGVFHTSAMGDAFYNPLSEPAAAQIDTRLSNRCRALTVLRKVLSKRTPAFCLVQSSLSTLAGGRGLAAYAAANAWTEALVAMARRDGPTVWQSVQWDAAEAGSLLGEHMAKARLLTADEVWQASLAMVAHPQLAEVAVTPGNLRKRLQAAFNPPSDSSAPESAPKRRVKSPLIKPRDPIEAAVAQAMSDMLGLSELGVEDNFFELGGHSLLAIQIINRLRREFSVEIPVRALLFEAPTAAGIAATISKALKEAEAEASVLDALLTDIESEREATVT